MKNNNFRTIIYKRILIVALLVFVLYLAIGYAFDIISNSRIAKITERYFAQFIFSSDDYMEKTNSIDKLDGWVMILNSELKVVESSQQSDKKQYQVADLVALQSGEYLSSEGILYYASIVPLHENGETNYGVVIMPKDKVDISYTIINPGSEVNELIIALFISVILFLLGFVGIVYLVSNSLKNRFSQPLYKIEQAFKDVKNSNYDSRLHFNSIDEFNNIRDSFNYMVEQIELLQNERQLIQMKRNQLFSDIGHDLKTPITIIEGYSTALIEGKVPVDEVQKFQAVINKQAKHVKHLANSLLDLINFEQKDYQLKLETTDICEFTRTTVIDLLPILDEHQISKEISIPHTPILIPIDKKLMYRTIANLITNIAHHNPVGVKAHFKVEIRDGKCLIIVADNGLAIAHEQKNNIFEPFVRADHSRVNAHNNNGLGLSIAKRIIQLHGGEIEYFDHWQDGMKAFIIYLELSDKA